MPVLFGWDDVVADVDEDARREAIDAKRERARMNHWCTECHGHTGPGSPCFIEPAPTSEGHDE